MGLFDDIYYDPVAGMYREEPRLSAGMSVSDAMKRFVDTRLQKELEAHMDIRWRIQEEKILYGAHAWPMYGCYHPDDKGGYDMAGVRAVGPLRILVSTAVPPGEFWLVDRDGNNIVRHRFRDGFDAEEYNAALEEGAFDD